MTAKKVSKNSKLSHSESVRLRWGIGILMNALVSNSEGEEIKPHVRTFVRQTIRSFNETFKYRSTPKYSSSAKLFLTDQLISAREEKNDFRTEKIDSVIKAIDDSDLNYDKLQEQHKRRLHKPLPLGKRSEAKYVLTHLLPCMFDDYSESEYFKDKKRGMNLVNENLFYYGNELDKKSVANFFSENIHELASSGLTIRQQIDYPNQTNKN